jgi:hypothetical protein
MSKPLTVSEAKVLDCLKDRAGNDENCLPSGFVATLTDLSLLQARRAIKSLQRRGYLELVRGVFDSDGAIAGSGYCCTAVGRSISPHVLTPDAGAK